MNEFRLQNRNEFIFNLTSIKNFLVTVTPEYNTPKIPLQTGFYPIE